MLRIGLIGCGWAGQHQAAALQSEELSSWAQLTAVSDTNLARLSRWAVEWNLPADRLYPNYVEMLEHAELDAVSVCLPTYLHHRVGLDVLASGRHLLTERPMAMSVREGNELVEAAGRISRVFMVGASICYSYAGQEIRKLVTDGLIGRPLAARATFVGKLRDDWGGRLWLLDRRQSGGGMLMTHGIDDVAFLRRILGEVKSVFARRVQPEDDATSVVDTMQVSLQFEGGALGQLLASLNLDPYAGMNGYLINGTEGSILCEHSQVNQEFTVWAEKLGEQPRTYLNARPARSPFVVELEHFIHCVTRGQTPLTDGADQLRSLAVIEAAYRSLNTGRAEAVEELRASAKSPSP